MSELQVTVANHRYTPPPSICCQVCGKTLDNAGIQYIHTNKSNYFKQLIENEVSILITAWKVRQPMSATGFVEAQQSSNN